MKQTYPTRPTSYDCKTCNNQKEHDMKCLEKYTIEAFKRNNDTIKINNAISKDTTSKKSTKAQTEQKSKTYNKGRRKIKYLY